MANYSWQGAASGALGGFAAAGPAGAVLGGIAGLFSGGGQESNQNSQMRYDFRDWTPAEREMIGEIERIYPGMIAAMGEEEIGQLRTKITGMIREQGMTELRRTFSRERAALDQNMRRTGGNLGSISVYQKGELNRAESEAASRVNLDAVLGGESVANARRAGTTGAANSLFGQYTGLNQNRIIGQTTTSQATVPNMNPGAAGASFAGWALANNNSYLNRNYGGNQGQVV
jgi:hypothetical protein